MKKYIVTWNEEERHHLHAVVKKGMVFQMWICAF